MELKFSKYADGLIPAIIQDAETRVVLMLGFMNQEAYDKTIETGKVTFYSRSRQTLWTKGETSGNFLMFVNAKVDCDNDTLLIKAHPIGPTCHTGTDTCWAEENKFEETNLAPVITNIESVLKTLPENSEITKLMQKGKNKLAQEVGEIAVKTVIQATNGDKNGLTEQSAELLYDLLALLISKDIKIEDVVNKLKQI
ncbi:MAG: bifunctional phosphoribosyl-AMP cyclohydrolase/phosphoribosyl-ATP diphosphatase HisIE [Bacteroidales bacterium]|nr:bifunctional phosphoribosyl-AMP cyclohydrolase/phosphoribosyl-ATP diphosphatase HisIE [Bacteroidales bacterium]MBR4350389.1 bifunctional phosphoribosyl-AMP cyclohydrolase/phosphoribosyl-ATP diphosphatase HisIE [Bacteroidales bacterium]MBR6265911.1 bifunctional phosphoribosyl-AMP cyclohydrolase/phosphoribosyl-ATP diphosphatase HisIE [Bacteroidales bacterium]